MASDTDYTEEATLMQSDKDVSPSKRVRDRQHLEDLEDRLLTLSDKVILCNKILKDLKDLTDVLVRKSLQDMSLPPQN